MLITNSEQWRLLFQDCSHCCYGFNAHLKYTIIFIPKTETFHLLYCEPYLEHRSSSFLPLKNIFEYLQPLTVLAAYMKTKSDLVAMNIRFFVHNKSPLVLVIFLLWEIRRFNECKMNVNWFVNWLLD